MILPRSIAKFLPSARGPVTIVVNVTSPADPDEVARVVRAALLRDAQRNVSLRLR